MNETEDLAFVAYMDEQAGAQEAAERRAYEAWAEGREPDQDSSEEAYGDYLEALAGV